MKHEKFITDFCKAIDQCHGQRPDRLWFSTWMSSKSPYFSFPQSFEKFWLSADLPQITPLAKKITLALRQTITVVSVLIKSVYLRSVMYEELRELSLLQNKKINLLRTFSYNAEAETQDPFWGDLADLLTPLVTIYDPNFSITLCKRAYNPKRHNFPYLAFISPLPLFKCHLSLLKEAFRKIDFQSHVTNKIEIKNYLRDSYQVELLSPSSLINLVFFECFQKIFQEFDIQKAYIPFENNPWEKMFHLAKIAANKNFKIIGFQHASIQEGATNYFLSSYENQHKLHPDKILSVGDYTFQYMKSLPYYKNILIETGCALRYSYLEKSEQVESPKIDEQVRLLVVLDGTSDTVNLVRLVLNFVNLSVPKNLSISIKEHPSLLLKTFFPEFLNQQSVLSGKIKIANGNLQENLSFSDIVLYTGTTSSIEALKMGKAVVNYNFSMFNYDPLFQFNDFKWEVNNPKDLLNAIQEYQALTPQELIGKKLAAKNFVNNYFSPCTKENIERFL